MRLSPYRLAMLHEKLTDHKPSEIERKFPHVAIVGASGSGKSTIIHKDEQSILKLFPNVYSFSISGATRKPRGKEKHGVDYFFFETEKEFLAEEYIEDNVYDGNKKYYGTLCREVEKIILDEGKRCCFDVDPNGAILLQEFFGLDLHVTYLDVTTRPVLKKRLKNRQSETGETDSQIENRLIAAEREHQMVRSGVFKPDYILPYDDMRPGEAVNLIMLKAEEYMRRQHVPSFA